MSRTYGTLFSGGELFGCGAQRAGWQHAYGFEIDDSIASVARLNGFDVHTADVCAVDYTTLPAVDHLHASPSCKTASMANTNGGESAIDLACADAVCRAIAAHTGRSFSLENVWFYRNYESFARILAALHTHGFEVDFQHVNAADFGVPQTRKRLILRAVRGGRVPPLHPTHRRGGDMFHVPWVGWYAAIEDLIPTLPETTPAPWQMKRLPAELREIVDSDARAFIVDSSNGSRLTMRNVDQPSFTIVATSAVPRAFIVSAGSNGEHETGVPTRNEDEPSMTIVPGAEGRMRAFISPILMRSQNAAQEWGKGYRDADEPSMTVTAGDTESARPIAHVGQWKRLTPQALGRLQTVPDSYRGLTPEINGNGVPCELARHIMESFR